MDIFKRFNVPKQRCIFCAPFKGENEGLRVLKPQARRRARQTLKRLLRQAVEHA